VTTDTPSVAGSGRRTDTRRRMVVGAAKKIATDGVDAMSLRDLALEAGVPLGSTYHHFPGGKAQLVDEAVRLVGAQVTQLIEDARTQGTDTVLHVFADRWRRVLESSSYAAGCPVAAAAVATDPRHHHAAREVFADWHDALTAGLRDAGVPAARAPRLARTVVAATEGAVALARASGSPAPLDEVVDELSELVESARRRR
jgi:TetR/AcrR family transcriptional regulator, lmrAB and yxaGH operons repressor